MIGFVAVPALADVKISGPEKVWPARNRILSPARNVAEFTRWIVFHGVEVDVPELVSEPLLLT